ncbi:xanthine dehydrogenase family protein molybdopterin-binding subunit [Bacillus sp. JJ1562]|uniref:xanthine dehydrogenase family protein molybdopterin-binding subunit n=1 Tax=Bacillus sp. JJ1562 TaxID=3122960 RepID=UPI003003070F
MKNNSSTDIFGKEIVTGKAKFTGDIQLTNMLHVKILRSPYPHAEILSIDTSEAFALPGVEDIISYKDIKKYNTDRPYLTDKARFVGDAIAAVAATDPYIAQLALKLIKVEWKPLPFTLEPEESMTEKFKIHSKGNVAGFNGPQSANIPTYEYTIGDIEEAFKEADIILEEEYETNYQCHGHIEPHCCIALVEKDCIKIWNTVQSPFSNQSCLSEIFDIPEEKIQVTCPYIGGGFGGKDSESLGKNHYDAIAITLAMRTKKPVKLEINHRENLLYLSVRNPFKFKIKIAARMDGKILGFDVLAIQNTGAYADDGPKVLANAGEILNSTYRDTSMKFVGFSIYTNSPVGGEIWGYGSPQITFAIESIIDKLANKLYIDPLEIRKKNHRKIGDPVPGIYGKVMTIKDVDLSQSIKHGEKLIDWKNKRKFNTENTFERTVGLGMRIAAEGTGKDDSNGLIIINPDGQIKVPLGVGNMGTGSVTAIGMLISEVLNVPLNKLNITWGNTELAWDAGGDSSRAIHCTGQAYYNAALDTRFQLLKTASIFFDTPMENLEIKDCVVYKKDSENIYVSFKSLVNIAEKRNSFRPWFGGEKGGRVPENYKIYGKEIVLRKSTLDLAMKAEGIIGLGFGTRLLDMNSWAAQFAEVEVDLLTGEIEVSHVLTSTDAGKIINYHGASKQINGGTLFSLGLALKEDIVIDKKTGIPLTTELRQVGVPSFLDAPNITSYFTDSNTSNRFFSKGIGETAVQAAAAIANSVYNATSIQVNTLPLTASKLINKLKINSEW